MKKVLANRYEKISEIGHGGAGYVYLAYDRHLKMEVAVKEIRLASAKAAGSLAHEADMLKRMDHPALPKVSDFFHEDGCDYLAMEYVCGKTLADFVGENGPFTQGQAILAMKKLVSVFGYLHSVNPPMIYRDLKPANIMVMGNGRIKLVDFGASSALYRHNGWTMRSGTPAFTAPELFTSGRDGQECSDIYSLGAVFYFLLTGKTPEIKKLRRNLKAGRISRGIQKIITRCLHENPDKRYQNVYNLDDDLENWRYFECRQIVKRAMKKIVSLTVPFLFLWAGFFMLCREQIITNPFLAGRNAVLWRWNEGSSAGLLFILAGFYFLLAMQGHRKTNVKIIKSICLTDKKTAGLWMLAAFFCLFSFAALGDNAYAVAGHTQAGKISGELPMVIREQSGHKILIQKGAIYRPKKDIIIEIPLDKLPKGEEMVLLVVLEGADWVYESREHLLVVD